MKSFKRWGVKDLLELLGNAMNYVIMVHGGYNTRGTKDAKMAQLEFYIANVNPQCWP